MNISGTAIVGLTTNGPSHRLYTQIWGDDRSSTGYMQARSPVFSSGDKVVVSLHGHTGSYLVQSVDYIDGACNIYIVSTAARPSAA